MDDWLICMMCGKPALDAGPEEDEDGDTWVYCRKCDCWTSHPPCIGPEGRSIGSNNVPDVQAQHLDGAVETSISVERLRTPSP